MSNQERTGWRDQKTEPWISGRHRAWGRDVPFVDVDGLVALEYDNREPVALIEYKHERARWVFEDANLQALGSLATRANIPAFLVRYWPETTPPVFRVHPLNTAGRAELNKDELRQDYAEMVEQDFVAFLYWLRRRPMPGDLFGDAGRSHEGYLQAVRSVAEHESGDVNA